MKKQKIYFIEYSDKIVFLQTGVRLDMPKNDFTFKVIQKAKQKFVFIDLLG